MRRCWTLAILVMTPVARADVDVNCMADCTAKYSHEYCEQVCAYEPDRSGLAPGSDGYYGAKEAQQRIRQRALEIELMQERLRAQQQANAAQSAAGQSPSSNAPSKPAAATGAPADTTQARLAAAWINERWLSAIEERKSRFPDFDAVVFRKDVVMTQDMRQSIAHSKFAADVTYYLATHRDEAERIAKHLDFFDVAIDIHAIESKLRDAPR